MDSYAVIWGFEVRISSLNTLKLQLHKSPTMTYGNGMSLNHTLSLSLLLLASGFVFAERPQSAATLRQKAINSQSEFYTRFRYEPIKGLEYEVGVNRRIHGTKAQLPNGWMPTSGMQPVPTA